MASANISSSLSSGAAASQSSSASTSFIPQYPEESILDQIATATANLAPQLYQWAQQAYGKGQSLADMLNAQAQSYASPTRVASDMGMAESGAAQGIDAARTNALQDLQSYGIDPSAGRFAGLDRAAQVQKGAAIAGAGNQQRLATEATGRSLQSEAANVQLANENIGNALMNTPNAYLGTAMNLKYPPLGQQSTSDSSSTQNTFSQSSGVGAGGGGGVTPAPLMAQDIYNAGGAGTKLSQQMFGFAGGGFVPPSLSPSGGQQVDDVPARIAQTGGEAALNAGEFVIPRDATAYYGSKFLQGLIDKSRKARGVMGGPPAQPQMRNGVEQHQLGGVTGYGPMNESADMLQYASDPMMSSALFTPGWIADANIIGDIPGSPGWQANNPATSPLMQIGPSAYATIPNNGFRMASASVHVPTSAQLLKQLQSAQPGPSSSGSGSNGLSPFFNQPLNLNFNPPSPASAQPAVPASVAPQPAAQAPAMSRRGRTRFRDGGDVGGGDAFDRTPTNSFGTFQRLQGGRHDDDGDDDRVRGGRHDDDWRSFVPPTASPPITGPATPPAPVTPSGPTNVVNGVDLTTGGLNTGPLPGMTPKTVMPTSFTGVPVDTPTSSSFYTRGFV